MEAWCNWCGTVSRVNPGREIQELGCVTCRRMFRVPPDTLGARLTEDEVLRLLTESLNGAESGADRDAGAAARRSEGPAGRRAWLARPPRRRLDEDEIVAILLNR